MLMLLLLSSAEDSALIDTVPHHRAQAQDSTSATYNTEDACPLVIVRHMNFWLQSRYFSPIDTVITPIPSVWLCIAEIFSG